MLTPLPLMSTSSPLAKYYTLLSWPLFSIISQWVLCFVAFNRQNLYQNITQSPMLQLPLLFVSFCYALVLFSPVMSFIWDGFYTSVVGGHVTGTQAWTLHCSHWLLSQSLFARSVCQIPAIPCSAECSSLLPPQSVRYVQHTLLSVQYPQWYPLGIPYPLGWCTLKMKRKLYHLFSLCQMSKSIVLSCQMWQCPFYTLQILPSVVCSACGLKC